LGGNFFVAYFLHWTHTEKKSQRGGGGGGGGSFFLAGLTQMMRSRHFGLFGKVHISFEHIIWSKHKGCEKKQGGAETGQVLPNGSDNRLISWRLRLDLGIVSIEHLWKEKS
jgi:hypothetical protein